MLEKGWRNIWCQKLLCLKLAKPLLLFFHATVEQSEGDEFLPPETPQRVGICQVPKWRPPSRYRAYACSHSSDAQDAVAHARKAVNADPQGERRDDADSDIMARDVAQPRKEWDFLRGKEHGADLGIGIEAGDVENEIAEKDCDCVVAQESASGGDVARVIGGKVRNVLHLPGSVGVSWREGEVDSKA